MNVEANKPNSKRTNLALIYQNENYVMSGAIVTKDKVVLVASKKITFEKNGKPSNHYIVKVPLFEKSVVYNICFLGNQIGRTEAVVIANVSIFIRNSL